MTRTASVTGKLVETCGEEIICRHEHCWNKVFIGQFYVYTVLDLF